MSDLFLVLQDVKQAVIDAAASLGVDLPDRQFVTMGGSVYDCEQLAVSGMSGTPGVPGAEVPGGVIDSCPPGSWLASVEVALVRPSCKSLQSTPGSRRGISIPDPKQYDSDAELLSDDFELLRLAANNLAGNGENQYGSLTAAIIMGAAQGGLMASVLSLTIVLWAPQVP